MTAVRPIAFLILLVSFSTYISAQDVSSKQDEKTGLYGFADADGNYVVKPIYKEIDFDFGYRATGIFKVVNAKGKTGFVNASGKEVVPCKYDEADGFRNGYTIVRIKTGEFEHKDGLLDSTAREVIAPKYGRLEYYPNDRVLVYGETNTSDVGLMDMTGKVLIPAQYEFWSKTVSKGLWPVGKKNICGVVNLKNETVVPFTYEMIESYSDEADVAAAKKGGKYGFIDRTGKGVLPFIYDDGYPAGPYVAVKKDGKWGLLTTDGKTVLPIEYASITSAQKASAWVKKTANEDDWEIDLATKQKKK